MSLGTKAHLAVGITLVTTLGLFLVAGCNKQADNIPPPGSAMQGGGPGGPGGMPGGMMGGGPGGRGMMGGGPGGGGGPVAENATGAEIYQQKCQFCHGQGGKGGRGPALASAAAKSDDDLYKIIHDGRQKMPAFGTQLSEAQIKKVVTAVKQLGSAK